MLLTHANCHAVRSCTVRLRFICSCLKPSGNAGHQTRLSLLPCAEGTFIVLARHSHDSREARTSFPFCFNSLSNGIGYMLKQVFIVPVCICWWNCVGPAFFWCHVKASLRPELRGRTYSAVSSQRYRLCRCSLLCSTAQSMLLAVVRAGDAEGTGCCCADLFRSRVFRSEFFNRRDVPDRRRHGQRLFKHGSRETRLTHLLAT